MYDDPWLARWLPHIVQKAAGQPILEIGCGWGWDTKVLSDVGLPVVGIDKSGISLFRAKRLVPNATFHKIDIRSELFGERESFDVIIGSLSLHYFKWDETVQLLSRIRELLRANGTLYVRVNSVNDVNYGAEGWPEIEPHFYLVKGKPKRFFDRDDLRNIVSEGWKTISIEEYEINRFEKPKVVWEIVLEKVAKNQSM